MENEVLLQLEAMISCRSTTPMSKVLVLQSRIGTVANKFENSDMDLLEVLDKAAPKNLYMMAGALDTHVENLTEGPVVLWNMTLSMGLLAAADTPIKSCAGSHLLGYYVGELAGTTLMRHLDDEDWRALLKYRTRLYALREDPKWVYLAGLKAGAGDCRLAEAMYLQ